MRSAGKQSAVCQGENHIDQKNTNHLRQSTGYSQGIQKFLIDTKDITAGIPYHAAQ